MSQRKIKPPYSSRLRRLARKIAGPAALDRALEGFSAPEREAMLRALGPHLKFPVPEAAEQTE